jgi:hypothetical protein
LKKIPPFKLIAEEVVALFDGESEEKLKKKIGNLEQQSRRAISSTKTNGYPVKSLPKFKPYNVEQRAKGLIEQEGKWINPKEKIQKRKVPQKQGGQKITTSLFGNKKSFKESLKRLYS